MWEFREYHQKKSLTTSEQQQLHRGEEEREQQQKKWSSDLSHDWRSRLRVKLVNLTNITKQYLLCYQHTHFWIQNDFPIKCKFFFFDMFASHHPIRRRNQQMTMADGDYDDDGNEGEKHGRCKTSE